MNLLMTGATGFIGNDILPYLLQNTEIKKLNLVVRNPSHIATTIKKTSKISLLHTDLVTDAISVKENNDILLHLAEKIPGVFDSSNYSINKKIAENIGQNLLLTNKIKKMIYISTLDVYGIPVRLPISESDTTLPITGYGKSKLENENFFKNVCKKANIPLTILRLTQVYGPNEPPIKIIPIVIKNIIEGKPVILNNNGLIYRDWIYIKDVSQAIMKAIDTTASGTFNVATGEGRSIINLLDILEKILQKKGIITLKRNAIDKRPSIILDIRKIKEIGYTPKYSLERGLADYIKQLNNVV